MQAKFITNAVRLMFLKWYPLYKKRMKTPLTDFIQFGTILSSISLGPSEVSQWRSAKRSVPIMEVFLR